MQELISGRYAVYLLVGNSPPVNICITGDPLPTSKLDLAHQIELLDLLQDLNDSQGRTIVMVLHDLNQACRYGDNLIVLRDG
ncbi:ABC transporter ATP-binding protein [Okeania sp. SIO2C2]|uniref:ABC transporter ATP-binding protein n=1 Tax=Okeania sp. SIO2C2 TaxID=2607787 RepID=UPI00257A07FB|nr:ABC transporter ATP-binding protein [Okeania sp. SIO2C2]